MLYAQKRNTYLPVSQAKPFELRGDYITDSAPTTWACRLAQPMAYNLDEPSAHPGSKYGEKEDAENRFR